MKKLAALLEVNEREVRKMVLEERNKGTIISADNDGYYIPTSTEELTSYYILARSRAITCLKSLKATRRRLKDNGVNLAAIEGR